ncbi:carboxylesterase family protein [Microbacterium sp. KR10-403]|uniref:carboxylesterase/lipase family protein n=1 Tax=Microbacterium sp. KR10-403 TaxID=3158581 RepID=UPI0032E3A5CF
MPVVSTSHGPVEGFWRDGSAAFLGVPFAAPPVGELRFAAPAPPTPWTAVRPATAYGPTPQRRPFGETTAIPEPSIPGEQTLNVNVFTPAPGRDAALPVLVWIHGGGYFAGSPASPWYDGAAFNRDGVVTVTISYRLGFDGFGLIDGAPHNRGILDQIAALEWVRDNIAAFGGDPRRVTIAGQSAGGGSVLTLLASPAADGLFHAAISASGVLTTRTADDARRITAQVAAAAGTGDWRSLSEDELLDAERAVFFAPAPPAASIGEVLTAGLEPPIGPYIDGEVVDDLFERLGRGIHHDTPLMLGTTANEFAFAPSPDAPPREEVDAALAAAGASERARTAFWHEIDRIGDGRIEGQLHSTGGFRTAVPRIAAARIEAGSGERTWAYDFRHHAPSIGIAGHCFELPFAWDLGDAEGVQALLGEPAPQQLADDVHGSWVRFISSGSVSWPSSSEEVTGAQVFDLPESGYAADAYLLEAEVSGAAARV